jgi:hypothetical protein
MACQSLPIWWGQRGERTKYSSIHGSVEDTKLSTNKQHSLSFTFKPYTSGGTTNTLSVESTNTSSQVDVCRTVGDVQVRKVKGWTLDSQGQARALVKRKDRKKLVKETKEMCVKRMRV